MKIVQMIYSLQQGGAERFVVNISNEMYRKGNEVIIVQLRGVENDSLAFNRQYISDGVRYINLGFDRGISVAKIRKVCKTINDIKPDIVHCHLNVIPYIFPLAFKNNTIKFIHTLHSIAEKASGGAYQKAINRWFYKTARIIPVTISDECRSSFIKFYNYNSSVARIDNGTVESIPTQKFDDVSAELKNINPGNAPVFIHVARFDKAKNQSLLINAFNKLDKEGIDFRLFIIGSGFDSDAGLTLRGKACDKIHFFGLKSNVSDYLLNSDYFILTSIFEGLPISLIEAMSAGCTPVCTPVGGIPDVIEDGKTGYLSKSLEIDDVIATIKRALQKPLDKSQIRNAFKQRFSIEKCADEYISIYKS